MRKRLAVVLVILLSACATSPDVTNDPRGGGFFGGVKGILGGDYDARVMQRQDTLAALDRSNELLRTSKVSASRTSTTKKRTKTVARTKTKSTTKHNVVKTRGQEVSASEIARMEEEKNKLEKELEASVDTFTALSSSGDGSQPSVTNPSNTLQDLPEPDPGESTASPNR